MFIDSEIVQTLNNKELKIYNYILEHALEFPYMSMRAIAKENQCSTTVVLSFTKKCGFESFKELKYHMKMSTRQSTRIYTDYDFDEIIQCLMKLNTPFYKERMNQAIELLSQKENVFFIGIGNSGIIAQYGARLFSSVGRFACSISDPFLRVNAFPENNALVVLSISGETPELVRLVSACKERHNQIIVITTIENSTLGKLGDVVIPYYISRDYHDQIDMTSQLPTISILEHLARLSIK